MVALCTVVAGAGAFAIDQTKTKLYTTSASLLFRDAGVAQRVFGATLATPGRDPARESATNLRLISVRTVAERTSAALNGQLTPGDVSAAVSVVDDGRSDVVAISATLPEAELAARLANTFGEQYIALRLEAARASIAKARVLVKRLVDRLPKGDKTVHARNLRAQNEALDILFSLQTGDAELVETAAVPAAPSSPAVRRDTILALAFGLVIGGLIALLFDRLDRRMRNAAEVGEAYGSPVLAEIPHAEVLVGASIDGLPPRSREAEAFDMLRANIRYLNVSRSIRSLIVTSARADEGKTTIAVNLARAAALTGSNVLLVEADLRQPSMSAQLGIESTDGGLATVLAGNSTLESSRLTIPAGRPGNVAGLQTLDVLLAGGLPPNPSQLLESAGMTDLIARAKEAYELLVIDTPPTSGVPDALALMHQVDGILLVARLGLTTRDAARSLQTQLEQLDAPVLGVVANAVDVERTDGHAYA